MHGLETIIAMNERAATDPRRRLDDATKCATGAVVPPAVGTVWVAWQLGAFAPAGVFSSRSQAKEWANTQEGEWFFYGFSIDHPVDRVQSYDC